MHWFSLKSAQIRSQFDNTISKLNVRVEEQPSFLSTHSTIVNHRNSLIEYLAEIRENNTVIAYEMSKLSRLNPNPPISKYEYKEGLAHKEFQTLIKNTYYYLSGGGTESKL